MFVSMSTYLYISRVQVFFITFQLLNMAERRQRRRISQEGRERLVLAFEEPDEDYLELADTLRINRSTARGIIARYLQDNQVDGRPRGGRNNVKVEMRDCLEDILNDNRMLTLKGINAELQQRLSESPS